MAIRINRGTAPQSGRITMPQGTFLSNPSTAADGALGGPGGMNPAPGWTGSLGYGVGPTDPYARVQAGYPVNSPFYGMIEAGNQLGSYHVAGGPRPGGPNVPDTRLNFANQIRNLLGMELQPQNPIPPVSEINKNLNPTTSSYVSPFVNKTQDAAAQWTPAGLPTNAIAGSNAMQAGALDGLTPEQVTQQMVQAGFTQKWVEGVGMTWFPGGGGKAAGSASGNGRPEWVDGASLAPGEDMVDAYGNRYVGGTPAPDGTPQYALNIANPSAARDTKGRYKWVSDVRKDQNGNWVRVNRQVLRKVYTRSHLKKKAAERFANRQPQSGAQDNSGQDYNQLVNLRVNYG